MRKSLQFSQLVFSQALGVTRGHISKIETGDAIPSEQLINLICVTWGIDKNWLVNGHGELKIKRQSNITLEEHLDISIEDMTEFKYNNLFNNLRMLSKNIKNMNEFFDAQELYIAAVDDFILDPGHYRNGQIIQEVEKTEEYIEGLKARIKKIKELKTLNKNGEIVPVSPKK